MPLSYYLVIYLQLHRVEQCPRRNLFLTLLFKTRAAQIGNKKFAYAGATSTPSMRLAALQSPDEYIVGGRHTRHFSGDHHFKNILRNLQSMAACFKSCGGKLSLREVARRQMSPRAYLASFTRP